MSTYDLSVVTPHGQAFSGKVTSVTAPGEAGAFGILANHAPIISILKAGVLTVTQGSTELFFAIPSGMLEFDHQNHCLVLADEAVPAKDHGSAKEKLNKNHA